MLTRRSGLKKSFSRTLPGKRSKSKALPIPRIVSETDEYVIIDKPALYDSQNSKEGRASLVDYLEKKYGFAGVIHRLDFGTSGLMVCAKDRDSAAKLTELMKENKIKRTYMALVMGVIHQKSGTLNTMIDTQDAETNYRVIRRFANASLVEAKLVTGRKHQIRRHFFDFGHPIIGDHRYKKAGSDRLLDRPALHACALTVDKEYYTSGLPEDFSNLVKKLSSNHSSK